MHATSAEELETSKPISGHACPLLVCESHPVQYKAPVYQTLARRVGARFSVVYASDCSVRGHADAGFGKLITWDKPLLAGYLSQFCGREVGKPLSGFFSLRAGKIRSVIETRKPRIVLLSQVLYSWDVAIILHCAVRKIPLALRIETQDEAVERSTVKSALRLLIWSTVYSFFSKALFIGKLNREHLPRHGFSSSQLQRAPYCVDASWAAITQEEKEARRAALRTRLGLNPQSLCVLFSGKLIPKKNPDLLLQMIPNLDSATRARLQVVFVGSGEMEEALKSQVTREELPVHFAGFVNQSALPDYYWAADIMVLPSRRRGETWGLVVNEALHAGCSVIVSEAVGSSAEFGKLERVRVIPEADASALGKAVVSLSHFERDFAWASAHIEKYSLEAAARGLECLIQDASRENEAI